MELLILWLLTGSIIRIYKLWVVDPKIMDMYCNPKDELFSHGCEYYKPPSELMIVRIHMNARDERYGWVLGAIATLVMTPLWIFEINTIRKLENEMSDECDRRLTVLAINTMVGVARETFKDGE